jgi:hypothetical protein
MGANTMEESNEPLIQLFRTVEEALSIAGSDSQSNLGLTLDTAELELNLGTTSEGSAGIELKELGVDASGKRTSESTHQHKLKLRRGPQPYVLGTPTSRKLAETILALAKATASVATRSGNLVVDEAVVTVDLSQSTEGGVKFGVGGRAGSKNVGKITLTYTKRRG